MTDTLISFGAVQSSAFSDTNLVGRVLGDADGRGRVEDLLQQQKLRGARAARRQPAPGRGAARRAARAARADRLARSPTSSRPPSPRSGPVAIDLRDHAPATRGLTRRPAVRLPAARREPADDAGVEQLLDQQAAAPRAATTPPATRRRSSSGSAARGTPSPWPSSPRSSRSRVTTRVPGCPRWLAGVVNWRGRVLAVVDPRSLLGRRDARRCPAARGCSCCPSDGVEAGMLAEAVAGPARGRATGARGRRRRRRRVGHVARSSASSTTPPGPISLLDAAAVLRLRSALPTVRR